jgi:hypoxanthine phosphoribosyltransferase
MVERWTWAEVQSQVTALADVVRRVAGDREMALYGVPRGGLVFALMLAHELGVDGRFAVQSTDQFTVRPAGAQVAIVIDDVCETGATFKKMRQRLGKSLGIPVCMVAVVEKQRAEMEPDASVVRMVDSVWVQFPWEREDADSPEVDCFGPVGEDGDTDE